MSEQVIETDQLPVGVTSMIRPFESGDVPFIFNSWLKSYRESPAVRSVPNTVYYDEHHGAIEGVIASMSSEILVSCDPEDPSRILGYVVAEIEPEHIIIHWVYCKQPHRRKGVAKGLLKEVTRDYPNIPVFYTHYTKMADAVKGDSGAIYNPYLLWSRR